MSYSTNEVVHTSEYSGDLYLRLRARSGATSGAGSVYPSGAPEVIPSY
jgi:hypothetical protein